MSRSRTWVKRAIVASVLALGAAVAYSAAAIVGTIPSLTGTLEIRGLKKPVSIIRDANAVPHIFGSSIADLYRGLGFAHAQDRLWQMELMRRAGQGRLSEIFGERTLDTDIFLRTLDFHGHSERSFANLPADAQELLEAYAAGVNAFIQRPTSLLEQRLPPEFRLLGYVPEPWRGSDSVIIAKMMALNLSANLRVELQRLMLAAQGMSPAEIADIMPLNDGEQAPPLPDIKKLYPLQSLENEPSTLKTADIGIDIGAGASNNWVVAGSRTKSGKALLANDPHLRLTAPSIWYLAHLALTASDGGVANAVGASLPGTPAIVLGRSDTVAWGFTNTGADVQDLFIEQINPQNPEEYLTPTGWRRFEIDTMEFHIAGGKTRYVERRRTRHGPVLPDSFRDIGRMLKPGYVAALQWTALSDDDTTIVAGLLMPGVRTVEAYFEKSRSYVVPMQNMVVADTKGNIGMIAPGRLPVRHPDNEIAGRAPAPGWDAKYDWQGYVPFEELPRTLNPLEGAIGTANARIVDGEYRHLITYDWEADYRQNRVDQLVVRKEGHDLETMKAAQLDVYSPAFAELAPLMISAARSAGSEESEVLGRLSRWDHFMHANATEPLIFVAWLRNAVRVIFQDDLGAAFPTFNNPRAKSMARLLKGQATGQDWCDDRRTDVHETCGNILANALKSALQELDKQYGSDRSKWSWGEAHVAISENRTWTDIPFIGPSFNVEAPSPGGPYTLNRGVMEFDRDRPYANRDASTFRAIYDFADLDRSLFMQPTGQSGNPFSPYYRTFQNKWAKGEYIQIPTRREEVESNTIGTWELLPPNS